MMSSLTFSDRQAIAEFITELQNLFASNLYSVILYGSKARDDAKPDSDIDLLIVLTDEAWQKRQQISRISSTISLNYDVLLMPKIITLAHWQKMTSDPFSFFREVFKDGLPVYGESSFFAPLLHHDVAPLVPIMANA